LRWHHHVHKTRSFPRAPPTPDRDDVRSSRSTRKPFWEEEPVIAPRMSWVVGDQKDSFGSAMTRALPHSVACGGRPRPGSWFAGMNEKNSRCENEASSSFPTRKSSIPDSEKHHCLGTDIIHGPTAAGRALQYAGME